MTSDKVGPSEKCDVRRALGQVAVMDVRRALGQVAVMDVRRALGQVAVMDTVKEKQRRWKDKVEQTNNDRLVKKVYEEEVMGSRP